MLEHMHVLPRMDPLGGGDRDAGMRGAYGGSWAAKLCSALVERLASDQSKDQTQLGPAWAGSQTYTAVASKILAIEKPVEFPLTNYIF